MECWKEQHGLWNKQENLGADKVLQRGMKLFSTLVTRETNHYSILPPEIHFASIYMPIVGGGLKVLPTVST